MTISAFSIKMEVIITPDLEPLYQSHKENTMADEKLYKLVEQTTTGWSAIGTPDSVNLNKEQCDTKIRELVNAGVNPNDIRAVDTNDPRFPIQRKN